MRKLISFIGIVVMIGLMTLSCGQSFNPTPTSGSTSTTALHISTDNQLETWYQSWGDTGIDQTWGVAVDDDGNIYTAGFGQIPASATFYDIQVSKFSPDGTLIWRTQWGGILEEKAFVIAISDPYVYIGGTQHTSMAVEQADMAVIALDMNNGEVVWSFTWGQGFGYEEVDGLVVEGDSIYVSGWTTSENNSCDIGLLKLDRNDGTLIWSQTWGSEGYDTADGQMVVDDEFIYLSGRWNGNNFLTGGLAVLVQFEKDTGEYVSHVTWGGAIFNDGFGLISDGESLYMVGLTMGFGNGGQIFLLKYDKDLNLQWQQIWGGSGSESARTGVITEDGNILIGANTNSYGNGEMDVALIGYSPDGDILFTTYWGGPGVDTVHGMVRQGDYVWLVGSTQGNSGDDSNSLLIQAGAALGQMPPNP